MSIIQGSAMQGATRGFYPRVIEGSLRFNDDDSAYLSWTPDSAGNRKTWTFSCWVKRGNTNVFGNLFSGTSTNQLRFNSDGTFLVYLNDSTVLVTNAVFRDASAWYHVVIECDTTQATASNRTKIYINGIQITSFSTEAQLSQNTDTGFNGTTEHRLGMRSGGGFQLDGYLADVHFIDGQAKDADDFGETKNGVWVAKDYTGTYGTNGFLLTFEDDTEVESFNTVLWRGSGVEQSITGVGFSPDLIWIKDRDSAKDHQLSDTVRGTKLRFKTNEAEAEAYASLQLLSSDSDGFTVGTGANVNASGDGFVAWCWDAGANNAVTGHSSVTYTGSGSAQSISGLPFRPDFVWIKGRSVNGENHVLIDSVRGTDKTLFSSYITGGEDTNTNRITSFDSSGFNIGTQGDINTSGRDYVAWAWDAGDGDAVSNTDGSITSTVKASTTNGFSIVSYTGNASQSQTIGHGLSSAPNMILLKGRERSSNWRVGHDGLTSWNYRLILDQNIAENTEAECWDNTAPTSSVFSIGNDNAVNASGEGFIAYCFHDVTGKQKFSSYTGTGSDVTVNVGFRPGFLLVKWTGGGGASAENWAIVDSSRDPINNLTKALFPDTSGQEQDSATNNEVEFTSTGFVVKNTDARWNANGGTYIYAAFAGSYSDFITDYNTDGTNIDSRVKANQTTGFSIVSYEGTGTAGDSFGHGLGATPDWILIKDRSASNSWTVWHSAIMTNAGYLVLDGTQAANTTDTGYWNATAPSSSVVTLGTRARVNTNTNKYIAYCWTEKTGYSKFGSYTGTGSSQTITTTFKPAFVIIKATSIAGQSWFITDNTRNVSNSGDTLFLAADTDGAEQSSAFNDVDFGDTGFTLQSSGNLTNGSGVTYIYAAFADTREAAFWLDQSGNDNDWQPVNLDHNDTVADSPTDNFCTLNPLLTNADATLSDGNLRVVYGTASTRDAVIATMGMSSGKWYWEVTINTVSGAFAGVVNTSDDSKFGRYPGNTTSGWGIDLNSGTLYHNDSSTSYATAFSAGDVCGVTFDADAGTLAFYKNGTSLGDAYTSLASGTYFPALGDGGASATPDMTINFGQQPFKYDPPE